jgi:hypothetical protein
MSDYKVGYGKPPKHSQFKPGVSPNPKGRPKRKSFDSAETIFDFLHDIIEYRENGKIKRVSRLELGIKLLIQRAMSDVGAAATLLRARIKADNGGNDAHNVFVEVVGWWPDHDGLIAKDQTLPNDLNSGSTQRP